ncbi:hypothetical protein KFK09_027617 [Dendrobium nobile]|uniref:Uncharacterized protein n=1 Tax=Dendrobium nobile TaxID=94219 RepID=A0A8T3AAZ3_DENNO|nr:hypothetical protein KFK09_027617 [Dendrobium nobile]
MVLPVSNIMVGPYAGDAQIRHADFVKSISRAKDCPKDARPEFAILVKSNVANRLSSTPSSTKRILP